MLSVAGITRHNACIQLLNTFCVRYGDVNYVYVLFCIYLFLLSSLSLAKFLVHCVLPYSVLLAVGKKFSFSVIVLCCYVTSVFCEFFFVVFYSRSTSLFTLWDCGIKSVNTPTSLSCPLCVCAQSRAAYLLLLLLLSSSLSLWFYTREISMHWMLCTWTSIQYSAVCWPWLPVVHCG